MLPKDLRFQALTVLLYAALVTLLGRHFQPAFLLFWLGAVAGMAILYVDPVVSVYLTSANLDVSEKIKQLVKERKFKELTLTALGYHLKGEQLILHSALFQAAVTILSFYIITSSGSLLGSGLVMGMVLHLVRDEVGEWKETEKLKRQLFWNIHRQISDKEQKIYLWVILALFGAETILLI